MKKIISLIKKHEHFVIWILAIFLVAGLSLNMQLAVTDELWNFQNIYKMIQGGVIYQDSNVIITPLFFYLGFGLFKLLGANFFVFRIYNIFIFSLFIVLIYELFRTLKISKTKSLLYTIVIYIMNATLPIIGANYNILAIDFVLLGILCFIKNQEKKRKGSWLFQGIIIFLVFLTKQNIGVYYMIGLILAEILIKQDKKKAIIELIQEFLVSAVLLFIFLIYLYLNGNLYGFLNYTVLGIREFAIQNLGFNLGESIMGILMIVTIMIIWGVAYQLLKNKFSKEQNNNIQTLVIFSIAMLPIVYPIFNQAHIRIALIVSSVSIIYIFHEILLKEMIVDSRKLQQIIAIILLIMIIFSFSHIISWAGQTKKQELLYSNPYFGAIIPESMQQDITEVCSFIKENKKDVIILSRYAALYMVPLGKSHGAFDLPFLGNLGKEGEDGLIQEIKQMDDKVILLPKEKDFIQESEKVDRFIRENYQNIGEINNFDIYEITR